MASIPPATANGRRVAVSAALLQGLAPRLKPERAELFARVINNVLTEGDISTALRLSHFLGQVMVETGQLKALAESLRYRNPERLDGLFKAVTGVAHARQLIAAGEQAIANTVYANRNGNGGPETGDGWRYRGRGLLQVTGKGNYAAVAAIVGKPLVAQPERLEDPAEAAESAAIFWKKRGINAAADADDLDQVTLLVNGRARLHMAERGAFQAQALALIRA
jgi:putative chitinase